MLLVICAIGTIIMQVNDLAAGIRVPDPTPFNLVGYRGLLLLLIGQGSRVVVGAVG